MSDDDTEAALASGGAADDETTVVPGPTQVAAALAWSSEEPDTDDFSDGDDSLSSDESDDSLWSDEDDAAYARGTVKIFVGMIAVAVIAAAWMVGVWATHRPSDPAPQAAPTTAAPLPPLSTTDAAFLRSVQSEGISIDGSQGSIDGLIEVAKGTCTYISQGHSKTDAAQRVLEAANRTMTHGDAVDFVSSAIESYCPPTVTAPAPPT
jgi:uncharacterized protein DUF732